MTLTQAQAGELLSYDAETGAFAWRATGKGRVTGAASAGSIGGNGYRRVFVKGKSYQAHRLAFLVMTGNWPTGDVDHINGDRADNRWANLRDVSRSENMQNQCVLQARNKSGHRGVRQSGSKWLAVIGIGGRPRHLGTFASREAAVAARLAAEAKFHPARVREFA